MNKRIIILSIFCIVVIFIVLIFFISNNNNKEMNNNNITIIDNTVANLEKDKVLNNTINKNKVEDIRMIYIKINNQILNVELEDNLATKELKEKLRDGDIIVQANEYGGFEKVGNLGFSLSREDKYITTVAGDIVLYQGNQISLFYNSNSWSYTKLGRIQNISTNEIKNILGSGDVTLTFTLSR